MESNSSSNLSEEREYVDTKLNTTYNNKSDLISHKEKSFILKDRRNTSFHTAIPDDNLTDKFNQKRLLLALEQEKTLRKIYESKNNILKNALNILTGGENINKITNIKSAQNLFISSFNINKKNSILEKLMNLNFKKTYTRNNLFMVNPLDIEEVITKELATNEMKSELNLLNLETKSLHTPKELEQENLKNFDLNLLNGADTYNYIETENGECLLYPDTNNDNEFNKITITDNFNTINTISHNDEVPISVSPMNRNKNRAMNNSCLNGEISYRNKNQASSKNKKDQNFKKRNKTITNKSVVTNKKALNNSYLPNKASNKTNNHTKTNNIKTINPTSKISNRMNENKKNPPNKNLNTKNYNTNREKNTINLKNNKVAPQKNTINQRKKNLSISTNPCQQKSLYPMLTENNKYVDVFSIFDSIFGDNLENFNDKTLHTVLETFDIKNLTKAFINCIYTQRDMIRDYEEKEINVNELNKQISLQDDKIKQLTKEIEMLKKKNPTSSRTPNKRIILTEESLNTSRMSNMNRLNNSKFTPRNINEGSLTERKVMTRKFIK